MAREKASYEELQAFLAHVKAGRKLAAKKEDVAADRPAPVKSSSRRAAERRIRVMVVDDHEITRRFLFHLIQHMKDMEVVGLAPDGNTALAMAAEVRRAPWRLMYKPTEKETHQQDIYDAARAFSDGAAQMDQTAAKLAGLIKASPGGLDGQSPVVKQMLKELQDRFNQFNKFEQALWDELQKK